MFLLTDKKLLLLQGFVHDSSTLARSLVDVTYNNECPTMVSEQKISSKINFKQTPATTYNYHCIEQYLLSKYSFNVRGHEDLSVWSSFRIARDTIAMICWSYSNYNIEINIHLVRFYRPTRCMSRYCVFDLRESWFIVFSDLLNTPIIARF